MFARQGCVCNRTLNVFLPNANSYRQQYLVE